MKLLMPAHPKEPVQAQAPPPDQPSFEAGLEELEKIVRDMESGDLPLEKALELFERGMKLSDPCRKQLEEAETRVEILMKRAGDVQPQPFNAQSTKGGK